jgi:NAD(P)-dependent dehydrogenase (short-subunit alcohol dehydrogenase family)
MVDSIAPFRLDGRVAILTGASSGIGTRLARALSGAGARVVIAARRVERLQALAGELQDAVAVGCDLASDDDIRRLVDTTLDHYGTIDILVNNAGLTDVIPAEDESLEQFRYTVGVNLTGAFVLTQLVARHMLAAGRGSIVNIASVLGMVGTGQVPQAGYAASKGGLINLSRELAAQWARRGVRVNVIAPGWFPSEMTADMFADESGQTWIRRKTPMGRPGELHELDGAIVFLASDASTYVTGAVLPVDGGWTAI